MNGAAGNRGGIAAFFDLDGTLVAEPSLEWRFFGLLRFRRAIPAGNYLRWLAEALRLAPRGMEAIRHANKKYLWGVAVGGAGEGGLKPAPTFFQEAVERVAGHALQGHAIVLVSGTLEPLAQEAARELEEQLAVRGIAASIGVCATRLEVAGERWTGRVIGEAMYGEAKARVVQRLAAEMRLDLARCHAYGDSLSDRWLLAAVGRPVAVNPAAALARIARRRDWPILHWKKKEPPQRHKDTEEFEEGSKRMAVERLS